MAAQVARMKLGSEGPFPLLAPDTASGLQPGRNSCGSLSHLMPVASLPPQHLPRSPSHAFVITTG